MSLERETQRDVAKNGLSEVRVRRLIEVRLLSGAKSRDIYEGVKSARASDVHNWPNRVQL
jgi:hypothetical protein